MTNLGQDFVSLLEQRKSPIQPNQLEEPSQDFLDLVAQRKAQVQIGDSEPLPKTKDELSTLEKRLQFTADIAFPVAGGIAGSFLPGLGNIAGVAVGSVAGKAVQEVGEFAIDILRQKKTKKIIPESIKELAFEETAFGNILKEGVFTLIGGAAFKALKPGFSALSKILFKGPINQAGFSKLATTLGDVVNKFPAKLKEKFIKDTALKMEKFGLKPLVIERVLREGPKKVLKPKFLKDQSISQDTINKVSTSFASALDDLGKKFNQEIIPVLKKNKTPIEIEDIVNNFSKDLNEIFISRVRGGKSRLIPKAPVDAEIAKTFESFNKELIELTEKSTPENLHKFKQFINKVLKKKSIRENQNASNPLFTLAASIRQKLDAKVPGYIKVTDKFREVFELEEQIGRKLSPDSVESLLKNLFLKDKQNLRTNVKRLMDKNETVKKILDDALDERAAKDFVSKILSGQKQISIPGVPFRPSIGFGGVTKEKIAKQLLRREQTGGAGLRIGRAAGIVAPQAGLRSEGSLQ